MDSGSNHASARGSGGAGWGTGEMGTAGRKNHAHARLLGRGLLLGLVLVGIFGMHVLTPDDGLGAHGALPMTGATGNHGAMADQSVAAPGPGPMMPAPEMSAPAASMVISASAEADSGSGMNHAAMASCILFLAAGVAALVLALLRYRRTTWSVGTGRVGNGKTDVRRRGPPGRFRPRVALCVIRV